MRGVTAGSSLEDSRAPTSSCGNESRRGVVWGEGGLEGSRYFWEAQFGSGRVPRAGQVSSSICFQVAQEIWVCEKQTITKWPGDILAYKEHLKSKLVDEEPQLTKRTHNV